MDRGWAGRVAAALDSGPVTGLRAVVDRYDAAGGGLLAGGLAYSALFAIVPMTILIAGIVGLVYADEARQDAVVAGVASVVPPLRDLLDLVLAEAARSAGAISVLGGLALIWGASRFVVAFEVAVGGLLGGVRRRGFFTRSAVAVAAVVGFVAAAVLGAAFAGIASFLAEAEARGGPVVGVATDLVLALVPLAATALTVAASFRVVPATPPAWRAIVVPAVAAAIAVTVLTRAFVLLAPRLIGAAATIGALATAFAALAWLSLCFQAVLVAAAWVRERSQLQRDRPRRSG